MAATQVVFVDPDDNKASELNFNVMLRTDSPNITAAGIGRIQQNAQMLFFQKMDNPKYRVVDVFIYGINTLGKMTDEAFRAAEEFTENEEQEAEKSLKNVLGVSDKKASPFDA